MSFNLHLFIQEIRHLPVEKLDEYQTSKFRVQIEWRGNEKTDPLTKGFKWNHTSLQQIQETGIAIWNEGFDHVCKLERTKHDSYSSWIIKLEIQQTVQDSRGKLPIVGKIKVDVADFAQSESEKSIKMPIKCKIRGQAIKAVLKIKLQLFEVQTSCSTAFSIPRNLNCFSCNGHRKTCSNKLPHPECAPTISKNSYSSSDGKFDLHYGKVTTRNFLINQFPGKLDDSQCLEEIHFQQLLDTSKQQQQASLVRFLSRNISKHSSKIIKQASTPLLELSNENRFQVGKWEKKIIVSRDGRMALVTDVFFASIDQRSAQVAGGNACTVLATVIAHWLHQNPQTLPLRCQFDELIREGSSEWRKLCRNERHKEKFSDQHFDLETVLESKVRPLSAIKDASYIGFFSVDGMANDFEFLQGAMSFDSIWDELTCTNAAGVYITSWNDHFFVLKAETDAIYLIDTLGERLFEGCNKAYILKFDKESAVYRSTESGCQTKVSDKCKTKKLDGDHNCPQKAFSEGADSCKMYIKEFLAALPLREVQHDIERGLAKEVTLHRRLQIEFHHTVPCDIRY